MGIKKRIYEMTNKNKDSLLNVLSSILDDGVDPETLAEIVKNDKLLFNMYKNECLKFNLLKKEIAINLDDIFGEV